MIRRLIMLGALVALPLGFIAATAGSSFAPATYNDSADTVTCGSFIGTATVTPALSITGSSPDSISVKGDVYGCTDGNGQMNLKNDGSEPYFYGKVSGTMAGTSNNLTGLSGCSSDTGTITVDWDATANGTEHLAESDTDVNVTHIFGLQLTSLPSPFNTDNMSTPGYGEFLIGYPAINAEHGDGANCPASASVPNSGTGSAFSNGDGGAAGGTVATTANDVNSILQGEESTSAHSVLTLGAGAFYSG